MTESTLRNVTLDDVSALERLFETNPDYTTRVMGREPSSGDARSALTSLPPSVDPSHKIGFGLWDGSVLVAYADVIRGWPSPDTAHIGILMTHGHRSGQGLGRQLHQAIIAEAQQWPGISRLRISIVDTNAEFADGFWSSLGYTKTGETMPYSADRVESFAHIWARAVDDR